MLNSAYMAKTLETGQTLNPIRITNAFGVTPEKSIFFLGGWEQNPNMAATSQAYLLDQNIDSAAFSAFDVIPPLTDPGTITFTGPVDQLVASDELLRDISPRMVQRALTLLEMTKRVFKECDNQRPANWVAAHCAGGNVGLIAHYLERRLEIPPTLPINMILLEPMIAEGRKPRTVASEIAKQARSDDPRVISLQDMRHPDAVNLGMDAAQPLGDILGSRGVSFLGRMADALDVKLVFGVEDIAAPEDVIREQLSAQDISVPAYVYEQPEVRLGHGYAFDRPDAAANQIRTLMSTT